MCSRHALLAALIVCALRYDAAGPAVAQNWPTRPLTMVVPLAPGGGTDVLGRIVGRRLSEVLGQQVIIENVGGAGGMVGSARVVKAAPTAINSCSAAGPMRSIRRFTKIRFTISPPISSRWC
jgi:tripartite-type tricarboxylate transporter receptor subunit TctC